LTYSQNGAQQLRKPTGGITGALRFAGNGQAIE